MIKLKQFDWSKLSNSIPKDVDVRKPFVDFLKNAVNITAPKDLPTKFFSKFNYELPLSGSINEREALITVLSIIIVADRLVLDIDQPSASDVKKFLGRVEMNNYKAAINEPWFSNMYTKICEKKDVPVGDKFNTFKNKFGLVNCKGVNVCAVLKDLLSSIFNSDAMIATKPVDDKPSKSDSPKLAPKSGGAKTAEADAAGKQGEAKSNKPMRPIRTDISIERLQARAEGLLTNNEWNIKNVSIVCGRVPVLLGTSGARKYAGKYSNKIPTQYTVMPGQGVRNAKRDLYIAFMDDPRFAPTSLNESHYLEVIKDLISDPWDAGRG